MLRQSPQLLLVAENGRLERQPPTAAGREPLFLSSEIDFFRKNTETIGTSAFKGVIVSVFFSFWEPADLHPPTVGRGIPRS